MLTQQRPLESANVTLEQHPNGISVFLAGNPIGDIKVDPVWSLNGSTYDTCSDLQY